eukprot:NODE_1628_length_2416_cov_5.907383.p2 GENE.NODE_1628_length_2416_cov_5.907383~~NODE_1628_length_2416_cov_5.907383.p2  ORF type:complete len:455 (+),score=141.20 NODE_1628_length_2416_cov_5.907383:608-1972(+)
MTCETRTAPALLRFDAEVAYCYVVKWWRRGNGGAYTLDSVSYNPHTADITVALAHPQRKDFFVTASLDGVFKCWDAEPARILSRVSGDQGAPEAAGDECCWRCVALGGWHSQPVLCGCLNSDGSVLVLGFRGFVALWEPFTGVELGVLAVGDAEVSQLFSVVCGRFLLLATVWSEKEESLVCWDLSHLEVVGRLDLRAALPPSGAADGGARTRAAARCALRAAPCKDGTVRLLFFRSGAAAKTTAKELQLWRIVATAGGVEFAIEAVGSAPRRAGVADAAVAASGRVLCCTTASELWEVALSDADAAATVAEALPQPEEGEDEANEAPLPTLARVVSTGIVATAAGVPSRLFDTAVRTTRAQQAGLAARLVERVVPPGTPSHALAPPTAMWSAFLAVYGKRPPVAGGDGAVATPTPGVPAAAAVATPPPLPAAERLPEFADFAWADELVQNAFP